MRLSACRVEPNGVICGGYCRAEPAAGRPQNLSQLRSVRGSRGQPKTFFSASICSCALLAVLGGRVGDRKFAARHRSEHSILQRNSSQ